MGDTTNGTPRPIGRKGDWVTREEIDARIHAANGRLAEVAAELAKTTVRLQMTINQDFELAVRRDDQLAADTRSLHDRVVALEARTLAGRIRRLRAWWASWLDALREPLDVFPDDELPPRAAIDRLLVPPYPEMPPQTPPPVRRIRWTGDSACLPDDLRLGFHEGAITRIDRALPIRNSAEDGDDLLCHVDDFITVAADGTLGVEPANHVPPRE